MKVINPVLPAGRLVRVEFEVCLPAAATTDQVEDWLNLHMGCGGMFNDNPLSPHSPEPFTMQMVLTDTKMNGRREEYDHRQTEGGGTTYRVRFVRTPA
ncbi:hypothetical protein [Ferrovibrio sp.]|uniref:hypothetical protein n=1 Tax=Ferrovibrio sp. TaxID=1917215 RepID=UPI00311F308A